KTNNHLATAAPIAVVSQPADLVVSAAEAPADAQAGQAIRVTWTVVNQGSGDTAVSQWTDRVFASVDPVVGGDIELAHFEHTGSLNAGDSYSRNEMVTVPLSLSGSIYLFVVSDAGGNVFEADKEDNNSSPPIPIDVARDTADLQVIELLAPATAPEGGDIT